MAVRMRALEGKTRIVAIDSANNRRVVHDYDSAGEAMRIAGSHNERRKHDDEGYYVYDSAGNCLRNPGSARSSGRD